MADKAKIKEQAESVMNRLNASPTMRVTEHFDGEGKLEAKDVEIYPRASSSVEFSVDSKGVVKPKVKIYHEDPLQAFNMAVDLIEKALKKASELS